MRGFDEIEHDLRHAYAVNDAEALLRFADELDDVSTTQAASHAHRARGWALLLRGDFTPAMNHFQRAFALCEQLDDQEGVARVLSNIGSVYVCTGDVTMAIEHYDRALALHERLGNRSGAAVVMGNLGKLSTDTGDYTAAVEYFRRALAIHEELGNRSGIAVVTTNLGNLYLGIGDFPAALEHYHTALALHEEFGDRHAIAVVTGNIGIVHNYTGNYPAALEFFHRALAVHEELGDRSTAANVIGNMGVALANTDDQEAALEHYLRALAIYEELGDRRCMANFTSNVGSAYNDTGRHPEGLAYHRRALTLFEELDNPKGVANAMVNTIGAHIVMDEDAEAQALLQTMDAMQVDEPVIRIAREHHRATLQERAGDRDSAIATLHSVLAEAHEHGLPLNVAETHRRLRDVAYRQQDLSAYVEHNNAFTRIMQEINGKETAIQLAMQAKQREIDVRERDYAKQLALLHSALPKHVADRVARGEVVNDAFENATVIFLDIVGFTTLSSTMSSLDLIQLLDRIFTAFDDICERHGVTKIKTIGDCYMAVAFNSVVSAALCALEMSRFRISHEVSHSVSHSVSHNVAFRIGMHCGPVTAGVIGKERMQYDVWGDTVNVASRMESAGEPGKVHVSEAFASELKRNTEYTIQNSIIESGNQESHEVPLVTRHSSLVTIEHGSINIKGKGPMQTYWLESRD
ncbi:MAG: tetratricopeptide repeat protein [Bacteroidetes bacterium]|nr:tetratricopeptide repeat protein [Bacteroidota bacterium]